MSTRIAIVGMACHYPDAPGPTELWENVLAGRRAFRRLPPERLSLADYWSPDPTAPDRFYSRHAAVIEGYEFDRVAHRVAGSTYRSTDLTHWLALDVAGRALADAGYPGGAGLPGSTTGVVVGNSLTGEFTRAGTMRLRWPYVRRVLAAALRDEGWDDTALGAFLSTMERRYKSPFPAVTEDSLAGGLSNTIAGRICNHFDLGGGGYTVDGACSSSLLSIVTACRELVDGELDVAIAGGVDVSIDPFEVVGFAKTGALATGEMRVYDRNSTGFWPGEGCGMLVLMRESDAVAQGRPGYASIAGWGVTSDGKGGITRPEAAGYRLALDRAYRRAGFGVETVGYFEGHGTGTAVGDATELRALSTARRDADPTAPPAAIGTVKGNIGHTKAAAGVAGVIKAALAVRHRVIPPATGHVDPHPELTTDRPALRVPVVAEQWPPDRPIRAGVSAMGFGGINAHLVLAGSDTGCHPVTASIPPHALVASRQDAELLLLAADSRAELRQRAARLHGLVPGLAYAELADLAGTLHRELTDGRYRAAVVCTSPDTAEQRLGRLVAVLDGDEERMVDPSGGVFHAVAGTAPRIGFLFPGQGSGRGTNGGALRRRFRTVSDLYRSAGLPDDADDVATAVAQPAIVTASLAALRVLDGLGIRADVGIGHSLGELTALHWAGAMDERTVLRSAAARGRAMAGASRGGGAMASVRAGADVVEPLLSGGPVVIAGYNGPRQTVVSGPADAVDRVRVAAERAGLRAAPIRVSHAFHSELVRPAAQELVEFLATQHFQPVRGRVVSTVTGAGLPADVDVRALLRDQVLAPVRFADALRLAAADVDLLIEVGPQRVLSGLAADIAPEVPAVAVDAGGPSLAGLLAATAAAWTLGAPVETATLFADRFSRPLSLEVPQRFFANPCETAPELGVSTGPSDTDAGTGIAGTGVAGTGVAGTGVAGAAAPVPGTAGGDAERDPLELLLELASRRAELPRSAVLPDSRPLDELHLSSITIGEVMNDAAASLRLAPPVVTSSYATATLRELAETLVELRDTARPDDTPAGIGGVTDWVRPFVVEWWTTDRPAAVPVDAAGPGEWHVFGAHPLAGPLRVALAAELPGGVLLCLPADADTDDTATMLAAAHAATRTTGPAYFVVLHHGRGATAMAKTLHLEHPRITTCVLDVAAPEITPVDELIAEVRATTGFAEVRIDADLTRRTPALRALPWAADGPDTVPLGPDDVVLVTGGGKGITAECALALSAGTGAGLGLVGRADPTRDSELAANLDRMSAAGIRFRYVRADVTLAAEVRAAVAEVVEHLGPVTAVLHGAGRNQPQPLATLDATAFRATLATKVDGLRTVLAEVDPARLRLLVTFGSIIARSGLRGEADYAVANDWLTEETARVARDHPQCRCLALEWSVWSGTGMGERLGVVESLVREGITPITSEHGIQILRRLLADPRTPGAVVVAGRAHGLPTLRYAAAELPLLRFVESPRVHVPGVELVADADLSADSDPYLADHQLDGAMLFPAVLGMEAMVQAGAALTGRTDLPVLEDVEFRRPIVVAPGGSTTIRIAALATAPDTVEVVIRTTDTAFAADHFAARLRYGVSPPQSAPPQPLSLPPVSLAADDLYGGILFQGKRFQRICRYERVAARGCAATVSTVQGLPWFGAFLPQDTLFGDAGARDAFMHGIQVCVPNATLLPVGLSRLVPMARAATGGEVFLYATELSRTGDTFRYDVEVRDEAGAVVERWQGLRLQAVRPRDVRGPWQPVLLGPYLQRRAAEFADLAEVRAVVEPDPPGRPDVPRRAQTALALSRALGHDVRPRYRPDGAPVLDEASVSAAHSAGLTFAIAGDGPLGCDIQSVPAGGTDWAGLLGDRFALAELVARETGEVTAVAATRVWSAVECARKAGHTVVPHPVLAGSTTDGWVVFALGELRAATFATAVAGGVGDVVFAILTERRT